MKASVDGRKVTLEDISAQDVRTIWHALTREAEYYATRAIGLERQSHELYELADKGNRRIPNRRRAGELEGEAAAYRSLSKDAADLARIIRPLVTDSDVT